MDTYDETYVFDAAADYVGCLAANKDKTITDDMLLQFYGLYKQATVGPCTLPKPGFFDRKGLAKWTAWKQLGDMSSDTARQSYVDQLSHIHPNWNPQATSSPTGTSSSYTNKKDNNSSIGPVFSSLIADDDLTLDAQQPDLPPLLLAASLGDIPTLTCIIKQQQRHTLGIQLDSIRDENGCTALHWAADKGHVQAVETLLSVAEETAGDDDGNINNTNNNSISNRALIDAVDGDGMTALYYAVISEQKKVAEMLLQYGATVDEEVLQAAPSGWREHVFSATLPSLPR
jgi:acyl-CoA-binding protein